MRSARAALAFSAALAAAAALSGAGTAPPARPTETSVPFVTATFTPGGTEAPTLQPWETPEPPTPTLTPKFVTANVAEWTTANAKNTTIFRATKLDAAPKWLKARPAKEMKFVAVEVEFYNVTTQTTYGNFGLGRYRMLDEKGFTAPHSLKHSTLPATDRYTALTPGSTARFAVVFEVPGKLKPDKMFYTMGSDRTIVVDLTHIAEPARR